MDRIVFGGWPSPLVSDNFSLSLCTSSDTVSLNWRYKDTFVKRNREVENWLIKEIADSKHDLKRHLKLVSSRQKLWILKIIRLWTRSAPFLLYDKIILFLLHGNLSSF